MADGCFSVELLVRHTAVSDAVSFVPLSWVLPFWAAGNLGVELHDSWIYLDPKDENGGVKGPCTIVDICKWVDTKVPGIHIHPISYSF